RLAFDPGDGSPTVPVGGVHFAQSRCDDFDLRVLLHDAVDHTEEGAGVELRFGGGLGTGDAEALLQVLFIAYQHIHVFDDAVDDGYSAVATAEDIPELLPEIEIERYHGAGFLSGLHAFDDEL